MTHDTKIFDEKVQAAKEWLVREYGAIRTGRANPVLLDGVKVQAYGSLMPVKQVANVSVEDARTIRVAPWDMGLVKDVERAITQADLGIGVTADSAGVRVTVPELTAERREQLTKAAKGKLEEARTAVRVARDEARKIVQESERAGEISEDDRFRQHEELQKRSDAANEALEALFEKKEHELTA